MSRSDLFFVTVAAVIFGGMVAGAATTAIIRYSRAEESGIKPKGSDLIFPLFAAAFLLFGMWRAGLFGAV